jgi:RNA polymerase sigma-70 factor (ECF subfamily)
MVAEHWTSVFRFVYCTIGNPHDAEDLTQETFLRAWNRRQSFLPGTNARAWLLRIAANAIIDDGRRKRLVAFKPLDHDLAAAPVSPGQRLEVAEQSSLLKAAMEGLTESTRMVFHLRAAEDLSFREIAELVGTTEQGARWHMHQARTKLLKQLAGELTL